MSVAYHLARQGVRDVLVVERLESLGLGSTSKATGGFRHQFSTEINIRLSLESLARIEHLTEETGHPVQFLQHGYLLVASSADQMEALRRNLALQQRLGVPAYEVSTAEIAARLPSLNVSDVVGGTFCPRDGYGDPYEVLQAIARGARDRGVRFWLETEVTGIETAGGRVRAVQTSRGRVETPVVVCAAGAWSARVGQMVGIDLPIRPYRRTLWATGPFPQIGHPTPLVIDVANGFHFRSGGQSVIFTMADPDDPPGYNDTPHEAWLPQVLAAAVHRVPVFAEAEVARSWAGLYEVTPDAHPIIGPVPGVEGFIVAAGFSGHGVMHSPATGRIVAELITTGRVSEPDISPLSLERFAGGATFGEKMVI